MQLQLGKFLSNELMERAHDWFSEYGEDSEKYCWDNDCNEQEYNNEKRVIERFLNIDNSVQDFNDLEIEWILGISKDLETNDWYKKSKIKNDVNRLELALGLLEEMKDTDGIVTNYGKEKPHCIIDGIRYRWGWNK